MNEFVFFFWLSIQRIPDMEIGNIITAAQIKTNSEDVQFTNVRFVTLYLFVQKPPPPPT